MHVEHTKLCAEVKNRQGLACIDVQSESANIFIRRSGAYYPLRLGWIQVALGNETAVFGSYVIIDGFEECGVLGIHLNVLWLRYTPILSRGTTV